MTSIKPPLPPPAPAIEPPSGVESVESTIGVASSSGAAPAGGVAAVGGAGAAGQADPIAELAAAIARGELSAAQAMDQLVDRALANVATHLDGTQRAELAGVLRAALDGDPAVRDALGSDAG
jgi:hypothetical protein